MAVSGWQCPERSGGLGDAIGKRNADPSLPVVEGQRTILYCFVGIDYPLTGDLALERRVRRGLPQN
jgi:hypothetical protein